MQNNIQAFNEASLDKRVDDLKKIFHEKKLIHHTTMENKKSRSGYIEISKIFKNYGFVTQEYIEAFSSGEESDIEDDKIYEPSVRELNEKILDFRTIICVKKIAHFPKNVRPGIVLVNLEEWVTVPIVKRYIEEIPIFIDEKIEPKISDIRIYNFKNVVFALVLLLDIEHTKKIYSYFNHPQKIINNPTKNSKGEKIEIKYAFDLLDMYNSEWYGVILRNIPEKCSHENLKNFLGNYSKNINYVLPATKIKSSHCSIVVLDSLEEAERICKCINKKEMGKNRIIKAHLHPRICLMRKNPENSIFKSYYKLDNGNYYRKYYPNNLGNILGNSNSTIQATKYTSINRILVNMIDFKQNNSQLNNNMSANKIITNENKIAEYEELKTQKMIDKENPLNNKNRHNLNNKDSTNPSNNNSFKKSTDFLNFYFDEEDKNKKKQTLDMNVSYLTKLIMKPSGSNKIEENKKVKDSNNMPSSSVNLFVSDLEEKKIKKELKENKIPNINNENSVKDTTGLIKKSEIEKKNSDNIINDIEQSPSKKYLKFNKIDKHNNDPANRMALESEDNPIEVKVIKEYDKNDEKSKTSGNDEKINNIKENKVTSILKNSKKKSEIELNYPLFPDLVKNQTDQGDLIKNLNSNLAANINNTSLNNNNKNESIISNLSGILKEMVKSDKEKTVRYQIDDSKYNINSNVNEKIIRDRVIDEKNKSQIGSLPDLNEKLDDSGDEIIDLNSMPYDNQFFKYDFQDKSYFEKQKNYRDHSKSNKDERSFHSRSKSIYDRSRDKDKDKERERDKNQSYSRFTEKTSKRYGKAEENSNQKNNYFDKNLNYQQNQKFMNLNNPNPSIVKMNSNFSSSNNNQNYPPIVDQNKISNLNNPTYVQSSNLDNINKTRVSNFTTVINSENYLNKDHKVYNSSNGQVNMSLSKNNNVNEQSIVNNNQNNNNNNLIQIHNQINHNYINNDNSVNYINNNQQSLNKNTSHSQFQSQNSNKTSFSVNTNIPIHHQKGFHPNNLQTGQQIPFNPIIQNNSTIINNYINIIPTTSTEVGKDIHLNQNNKNIVNNSQYQNSNTKTFTNIQYNSGVSHGNISNLNLIYEKNLNASSINNLSQKPNIPTTHKGYSTAQNITLQNNKTSEKNNGKIFAEEDIIKINNDKDVHQKDMFRNRVSQSLSIQNSSDNKNEIILPPSDDFIPPLPPENPPEPESLKLEDKNHSSYSKDAFSKSDFNKKEAKFVKRIKVEENTNDEFGQQNSLNCQEKTEPGQISNYNSGDESFSNVNSKQFDNRGKKIDVKNAPINFKKYNLSRSSSSSSNSYRKKDYINKKREREKGGKNSRERERNKDKKKRKYRSRSKERYHNNINNNYHNEKYSNGATFKKDRRDYKDNQRNESTKKYHDEGIKKYSRQENRSSSSSSSFQSGEEGRYYKRFLERRTTIKKEKK